MNTYYISKNGNQLGPFPVDEIQSMLMSGEIDGGDFCWTDGMEQWQSIQEWEAALRAEQEIKVPSTPHSQPLGPKPLKQPAYQAPQMKTPAGRRKGKGMIIGGIVFVAVVIMGGVFLVLSSRVEKRQMAKNIDAATRTKPGIKSEKIKDAGAKNIDAATRTKPFVNSLGMKFVPVPITGGDTDGQSILLCVWETRHKDFKAFVDATGYDATKDNDGKTMKYSWDRCGPKWGKITTDHPVVYVSWEDAQAFCQWLTKKERDAGTITASQIYRLPTDHEWSCAVGIGKDENASESPEDKSLKARGFPWGGNSPPPKGAGNYHGEEVKAVFGSGGIEGYRDEFPATAPVGSFQANKFGIYDLGGNVCEWCEDAYAPGDTERVARGSAWMYSIGPLLKSSMRGRGPHNDRSHICGFRCVLAKINLSKTLTDKNPATAKPKESINSEHSENQSKIDPGKRDEAEMNALIEQAVDMIAEAYPELNRSGQRLMLERLTGYKIDSLKKARRAKSVVNQLKIAYQVNGSSLREAIDLVLKLSQN